MARFLFTMIYLFAHKIDLIVQRLVSIHSEFYESIVILDGHVGNLLAKNHALDRYIVFSYALQFQRCWQ